LPSGENRGLVSVHLGLLRSCAEAAACSKAKVTLHPVNDQIQKCHLFQVQKTTSRDTVLIVASDTSIKILFWDQDSFVLRKTVTTPIPIKGIITTPNSIIFGYEKIFELDITNFVMEGKLFLAFEFEFCHRSDSNGLKWLININCITLFCIQNLWMSPMTPCSMSLRPPRNSPAILLLSWMLE